MADERAQETPEQQAHAPHSAAAWAALNAASQSKADAFLEEQTILTRLQAKELAHELALRHWSMRFGNVSSVMKVSFEIAMALIVMFVVALIAGAVWSAAHDDGLVIHAFSVPPDLAARGMTGEVVAGRMLDKLSAFQAQTDSLRPASSYSNNWGDDIKVQIPDTGVSIGEFNRYLHQWLGNETHITGDVVRAGDHLIVTARAGADAAESFNGSEGDLDGLLNKAAESIYARTQPYRYGVYLYEHDKLSDALAVFRAGSQHGSSRERAWDYIGVANGEGEQNLVAQEYDATKASVTLDPDNALAWYKDFSVLATLGRDEAALASGNTAARVLDAHGADYIQPGAIPMFRSTMKGLVDDLEGDYTDEVGEAIAAQAPGGLRIVQEGATYTAANAMAEDHALPAARSFLAHALGLSAASSLGKSGNVTQDLVRQNVRYVELLGVLADKDWPHMLETARAMDANETKIDAESVADFYLPTNIWPYLAYAEAMTGDFRAAHRDIDRTPLDCDPCLQFRADIDAAEKNERGAAYWFARATLHAPSIPFAYTDWGGMLLRKGDYAGAIGKFRAANLKGPHFADPLEMWGEALMQQNRSDLALAKFEEASKYAPNWGRLHLEWGKALVYAGKKDEARKQFIRAADLGLSQGDKADLEKWREK